MFRALYHEILAYEGDALFEDILKGWVPRGRATMVRLTAFQEPVGRATPRQASPEDRSELYALSRVSDYLLLPFQDVEGETWNGPGVSRDQYASFFTALGLTPFSCRPFSPFYHEVVAVTPSENPSDPERVVGCKWPGLLFGELLFSRAGVRVTAGRDRLAADVAGHSTLYFTHRRLRRRTQDLSIGWGANSQWRTSFRRDYRRGGLFLFNVDGEVALDPAAPPEPDEHGLTFEERVELCTHRCFVRTRKDDTDLFPYRDRYAESACRPSLAGPDRMQRYAGAAADVARAIKADRAFERLPVLADVLEEGGCTDAAVLGHCREGAEHGMGDCWVVDLLLSNL
jgi:hypothetical protein